MFHVSPAEPKAFLALGDYSSLPETYGADFVCYPHGNIAAIQRKTCTDLVASIRDDRLSREMSQLKEAHRAVLIVEGSWAWSRDNRARLKGHDVAFLRAQYDGIVLALQANNIWVVTSPSIPGTIRLLHQIEGFLDREKHESLFTRPKARGLWGTWRDRDWACHVLQGWDGLSTGRGGALYDAHGLPLTWTITKQQMLEVPGIGPETATKLWRSLNREEAAANGNHASLGAV